MGLEYAAEKLGAAILCAIQTDGSPQERLASCCEIFTVHGHRGHLTVELQKRFDAVAHACGTQSGKKMDDETARKWLAEMLSIYAEVVQSVPLYDAGIRYERRSRPRPAKNI
jgi:hypothetical protein